MEGKVLSTDSNERKIQVSVVPGRCLLSTCNHLSHLTFTCTQPLARAMTKKKASFYFLCLPSTGGRRKRSGTDL
jgi:hypothetical protein